MFNKILIANRGEIAARICATCREMGIRTVAVYSDVDRQALHVRMADEAYPIGPAPATASYLNGAAIIEVARSSGAQAIHPGYGFLSENPAFVEACEQAGIVFIGPPAGAMRLMASKIAAKELAVSVGAPTVPGYNGQSQDDTVLMSEAERVGFPLLIKASAGGGGKGMRAVYSSRDMAEQLAGARREALAAFGDETVFLERLILQPRHVEIQVLGDMHGNLVHLGERECSIQRRHQKIVEESPSVALTPALRRAMGEAAVRIARAASYVNAGTLEFMLDEEQRYYFLEMNTRLQVEHPVTELVTGLDLVRHQLLIAAGEPLSITQEQIEQRGHAIEVRLYAEDPKQHFLPSTGDVTCFVPPEGPGVRLDSGIATGDAITQYYDPMIAKLIVYGEDRPAAIARLQRALEQCALFGVTTNIALLHTISIHPAFQQGKTHTSFLEEYGLLAPGEQAPLPDEVLAVAALDEVVRAGKEQAGGTDRQNPWRALGSWRMTGEERRLIYHYGEQEHTVLVRRSDRASDTWQVQVDDEAARELSIIYEQGVGVLLREGANQQRMYVQTGKGEVQVACGGETYRLQRRQPLDIEVAIRGGKGGLQQKTLTAPMAGTIVKVQVKEGEAVEPQQVLVVLSAMKMEHAITAPFAGQVQHIFYQEGAVVPGGAVIVEMA